jgi:hypothetical protein
MTLGPRVCESNLTQFKGPLSEFGLLTTLVTVNGVGGQTGVDGSSTTGLGVDFRGGLAPLRLQILTTGEEKSKRAKLSDEIGYYNLCIKKRDYSCQ